MEIQKDNWTTFFEVINEMENGYVLASLTDQYVVDRWPMAYHSFVWEDMKDKVLEIRVFNEEKEIKLFRTDVGREFQMRTKDEEGLLVDEYMDEYQYLDIDEKRSQKLFTEKQLVRATGGGTYHLPLEEMKDACLQVRYYFRRDEETGVADICDWRAVKFLKREEENDG